jgi:two-component system nitrogen regulation sensor histidine kinase GlnL
MVTPHAGLELLSTAVLMLDESFHVTYANPAAETLLAHGRKHLLGVTLDKALPGNEGFLQRLKQSLDGDAGFNENDLELDVGGERVHLHCVISPVEAGDSRLLLEFRELEQQLKIAREAKILEQQEANRELIRNLAHEIKNPLGGIRGAAQLLETELRTPGEREYTGVIIAEADRLQGLVDRVLASHRSPRVVADLNIHEVCERVRSVIMAEYPNGLLIDRDYDASVPEFRGDREQLIQALLNVVRNAAQALKPRVAAGDAVVQLRTRVAQQVTVIRRPCRLALDLRVIDNGPGIPDDLRERVFDPLVSGREGGSGLGLSLAQEFIHQNGGTIDFESVPGRTDFRILLPLR